MYLNEQLKIQPHKQHIYFLPNTSANTQKNKRAVSIHRKKNHST